MNRAFLWLPVALVWVFVVMAMAVSPQLGVAQTVSTIDGDDHVGMQLVTQEGKLVLQPYSGDPISIPPRSVVNISFATPKPADPSAEMPRITFHSGDVLMGNLKGMEGSSVSIGLWKDHVGKISVLEVAMVEYVATERPKEAAKADVLVFRNLDIVEGSLAGLDTEHVDFNPELDLGETRFKTKELAAVFQRPARKHEPGKAFVAVAQLVNGGRLTGTLTQLTKQTLTIKHAGFGDLEIPVSELASLRFRNGDFEWLSDLTPRTVDEGPSVKGEDERVGAWLWPWRRDGGVTGGSLKLRGVVYEKGIGTHTHSSLEFDLHADAMRFRCIVGVDDTGGDLAALGFRVLLDGEKAWDSGIVGRGDKPKTIDLDVAGKRRITLITYTKPLHPDIQNRAAWARALVTRKPGK